LKQCIYILHIVVFEIQYFLWRNTHARNYTNSKVTVQWHLWGHKRCLHICSSCWGVPCILQFLDQN